MNPKASKINDCGSASVSSDLVIQSLTGSIADMTIASNNTANTVKVPNRQKTLMQQTKMKHNNTIEAIHGVNQEKSELVVKNPSPTRTNARSENHRLDAAILGRLDRRDFFPGSCKLDFKCHKKNIQECIAGILSSQAHCGMYGSRIRLDLAYQSLQVLICPVVLLLFQFISRVIFVIS